MIYRFAAICALVFELLLATGLVSSALLHNAGPLTLTGALFTLAFCLSEGAACIMHGVRRLRHSAKKRQ